MLTSLQIKHFAIADHIELEFKNGLSVITGETGAGKSIIINALALVLGQRADSSVIKHGQPRAEIQANFDLSTNPQTRALLGELELDEEYDCQMRRVVSAESGSKAYINGRLVTARILREVGETLLDIHGQHEHQSLLRTETQLELLDKYAGITEQVMQLSKCYQQLQQQMNALEKLRLDSAAAHEKLEFLRFQLDEFERFSPQADEWTSLYATHQRIHHQAELLTSLQSAEQTLFGHTSHPSSVNVLLGQVLSELEKAASIDPQLKQISELLLEAQTLVLESEDGLRRAGEAVAFDENELESIEQRYTSYMEFARKHRVQPQQLYDTWQGLLAQREQAENPEQSLQVLQGRISSFAAQYAELAKEISAQRKKHARRLAKAVSESIQTLAMEGGEFDIVLQSLSCSLQANGLGLDLSAVGREKGCENISFNVSTNAGMPSLPLARIASGGELSRISLAIQLILSDLATVNSLVFDEVDVGVGGKTAAVIGKMLAKLAESRQILCITHLPQVAAYGSHHFHVYKQQGKQVQLSIEALNQQSRITEVARMVGGENISDESLAHARSLIENSAVT